MEHALMHKLARALWRGMVIAITLLAVYVSFGRLLVDRVSSQQGWILTEINRQVPFAVAADGVSGVWRSFSPELVLSGLRLQFPGWSGEELRLAEGRVRIDPLRSLLEGGLQVSRIQLAGLDLPLQVDEQGRITLVGFERGDSTVGDWLRDLALSIEQLELHRNTLSVLLPDGTRRDLVLDFSLLRDGSQREMSGNLSVVDTGTQVQLAATGLGDPFDLDTFEGRAYMGASDVDLSALHPWLPTASGPLTLAGVVDLQLWLDWREGRPQLRSRVRGSALELGDQQGSWQLPLQQLAFDAALGKQDNNWQVFVHNLLLSSGESRLIVPRLQMDMWGDSLRLRGEGLPLEPVSRLYASLDSTPDAMAEALRALNPLGLLRTFEVSLDDRHSPLRGWQLAARFNEIRADSWRGTPGVEAATGYVHLMPGSGQVILDATDFSLNFPTIYDHPLDFEDIHGTVDLTWNDQALTLHSGQVVAQAAEGETNTLFGLSIPFAQTPAGIEMDLLVGLRDSKAAHRDKYLPVVLNGGLLRWLREGLGEGDVRQGAFLWRGSLDAEANQLRTVQLFFDVAQTALRFQPDWPPLSGLSGLVLIDDTNISVWGDSAQLYRSQLSNLSAEAWHVDGAGMQLAVHGTLAGPAEDGLQLVRESPLADLTGHVFDEWSVSGDLALDLALQLQLTDPAPAPRVAVSSSLRDARVEMKPLGLSLSAVSGKVDYHSDHGFTSRGLVGKLWGQRIDARLQPLAAPTTPERGLSIALAGQVPATPLQQWLGLATSLPAEGTAEVTGELQLVPGASPTLAFASDLEGVALALPPPLNKVAPAKLPLQVALTMEEERQTLDIDLERRLNASLLLGPDAGLIGGDIALQETAHRAEPGVVRLRGHLPSFEPAQWQVWLDPAAGEAAEVTEVAVLPPVEVDALLLDSLSLGGVELRDVVLNGRVVPGGELKMAAETDWLQGELDLEADGQRGSLVIGHLNLSALGRLGSAQGEPDFTELPTLAVSIDQLRTDSLELGYLAFDLQHGDEGLRATSVTGELAGLALTEEQPGQLLWRQGAEMSESQLDATLHFADLGGVLERLDYERIVDTERGSFHIALDWPGGPQDFALATTRGRVDISVLEGRFLEASAGTSGTLRVLSIFNLAEIVRRLSLSHMFESGIPFDSVEGEMFFHSGSVEVPKLEVKGASSSFNFTVVSPLREQTLDGELVATLPVASNLPWVAALTAGLPVAAGVYVVSKVFEQQMNRMSSAVYKVAGSWDDPEVKFSRIFDTSSKSRSVPEPNTPPESGPEPVPAAATVPEQPN
ncbi:TIGR02099 family protein [Parahaliea maris]|uniref:TIGR02099 family protein n=1 Tax=Parahaliea maris TaxID=2716870 RepID=A0A5C9A8A9_9GAMM|nr:YhdP family protein [Parahaliea maris]TXS96369.1 TIGR02099 family protein [Parahaliea maris]